MILAKDKNDKLPDNQDLTTAKEILNKKSTKENLSQLEKLLSQANLNLYGTDRKSAVDDLNTKFSSLLHSEIDNLTQKDEADITSFINRLYSNDKKSTAYSNMLDNQFLSMTGSEAQSLQGFMYDMYRNRLLEQNDLHEVASQLIELRYIIPYSKIFNDFMRNKNNDLESRRFYRETTLFESVSEPDVITKKVKSSNKDKNANKFLSDLYTEYVSNLSENELKEIDKNAFMEDVSNILKNISICNDSVPLPVLEEGHTTINQYMSEYVNETGDKILTEDDKNHPEINNFFNKIINDKDTDKGITFTHDSNDSGSSSKNNFDDIKDCYIRLIDPTKIIPIKIMDQVIGYYYVQEEDITPLAGMISSTLYFNKFDEHAKQQTIVDSIAKRIVECFDKDFLKDNIKFKRTIVEAINYYNLNEKRLKFQFIPVEYIQEFKIDEDEYGNGQSMIKKSLFYAKLYLMLLLFKIMTIILNSNDQKVNYIKTSGIDKDVANKVQEIARIKQSRQINMYDLFNYTTLINKVGNGSEMYVPVGRSGERPVETEILSGQEVQLNSDLLEMLKNSYILGTGVPAAIVNYLNEAEFAKVVEQNNTKFNGRVVNYQLDFNSGITNMYKKILKWSTNIPPQLIDNFEFVLQPPKTVATNAKSEAINGFNQLADFLVGILFEDPGQAEDPLTPKKIRKFKELYVAEQLPMLNMDKIKEILDKVEFEVKENEIRPKANNGDDGEDDGLEGVDLG